MQNPLGKKPSAGITENTKGPGIAAGAFQKIPAHL